jgi:predicted nucleic acid-binding protein
MNYPQVAAKLTPLIQAAVVATCATLDAEALYSARSPAEYEQLRTDRREAYEYLPTDDAHWQQAFDVQRELARTRRHRAVDIADLLTAVLAADHGVTVVHYDADFEVVAEVFDFHHRWVLARGSA